MIGINKLTFEFKCFLKDESGATAIEYGLVAALISIAIMGTLNSLGRNLVRNYFWCVRGTLLIGSERAAGLGSCQATGIHQ